MKKFSKTNKGFTLVELLATIVIVGILLGIGIVAVMHFIDRAKEEQKKSNEKALVMAAKSYLQENRSLLPKSIGDTTVIYASVLTDNKYITDPIKNQKNESCMDNSYVTAYKASTTKYEYTAHIYCGDEQAPDVNIASQPDISIDFVDASGNSVKNNFSEIGKISEVRFIIDYSGGIRKEGLEKIPIEGYSYSVLVDTNGGSNLKEIYSSGTLNANRATDIRVDRDNIINDYIDISGTKNTVAIRAVARNVDGGVREVIATIGGDSENDNYYADKKSPTCVVGQTMGEASENTWINFNSSYNERRITVVCNDSGGSGCIRTNFTKTWSGSDEKEYDTIQIKDNAGNSTNCKVRVNFDKSYPRISLDAYARGRQENSILGNSILKGKKNNNDSASVTINADEYDNLINGFMSKAKYPFGVIYRITLTDGVAVKNWKWQVNASNIMSTSDPNYEKVGSIEEAKSDTCSSESTSCDIYVALYNDGLRKGVLTVYDKAGNESKYIIYANIDKSAPDPPTIVNSSSGNSVGEWTSDSVTLDLIENNDLSSLGYYYYTYNEETMDYTGLSESDADTKWVKWDASYGKNTFTTPAWNNEMNKMVYVSVCDVIGNCSDASSTEIKIDRTAPIGLSLVGYKRKNQDEVNAITGLETIANDTWHKGWVVVAPTGATDTGSKGIYYVMKSNDIDNPSESKVKYVNVNNEGVTEVSIRACDKLDNCSASSKFTVKLDRTAPTLPSISNSSNGNWTTEDVTLSISGSEDAGSKIGKYYYSYSSSASTYGTNPQSEWVEMEEGRNKSSFNKIWPNSTDINKKIYIKACDKVGNCSSLNNTYIKIDNNVPVINSINNPYANSWSNKSFSITINSSDGTGSGIDDYYQYTYNANATEVGDDADTQWKSKNYIDEDNSVTALFSVERNQFVYIRVCDKLGNCSAKRSTMIRIDKTKPECGEIHVTTNNSTFGIGGYMECSDPTSENGSHSECEDSEYSFSGLIDSDSITIKDNAQNTKKCPIAAGSYDCSEYDPWEFEGVSKNGRECPIDQGNWDFELGSCSANFYTDLCSTECGNWCASHPTSCNIAACCVKRRRKNTKVCYKLEE